MKNPWSRTLPLAPAILVVAALSACSGGGTASGGSTQAAQSQSPVAKTLIAEYGTRTDTNPQITIEKISKPAPTGKRLEVITCAVPICALYTKGAVEAAKALGWKTKTVVAPFTPEGFKETWDSVLQDKPDAVVVAGVAPTASVASEVKQAVGQGIVVVGYGLDTEAGGSSPYTFATTSAAALRADGHAEALTIVADAKGPANVLMLTDPSAPNLKGSVAEATSVIKSAGGAIDVLNVSSADIGKNVPNQVVTYLQSHPKVQYVALPTDDYLPGVAQALASAQLSSVKLVGAAASNTDKTALAADQLFATDVHPTVQNGWYLVDAIVRKMVGDPIADANPVWPYAIVTKSTVGKVGDLDDWPHLSDKFKAAWNVR